MSGQTTQEDDLAAPTSAVPAAEADPTSPETPIAKAHAADAYACRLHPDVESGRPGFCRECGAPLEPVPPRAEHAH